MSKAGYLTVGLFFFLFFSLYSTTSADTLTEQTDHTQVYITITASGNYWVIPLSTDLKGSRIDTVEVRAEGLSGFASSFNRAGVRLQCYYDAAETQLCDAGNFTVPGQSYQTSKLMPPFTGEVSYTFNYRAADDLGNGPYPNASTTLPMEFDHARILVPKVAGKGMSFYGTSTIGYYVVSGEPVTHAVNTNIATNTTWKTQHTYVVSGAVAVNSGSTLTIESGAIVKFDTATTSSLTVNGTLNAVATSSGQYILFTSYKDDFAGWDANGDATSTSPTAGDWSSIIIGSGGAASFGYSEIRYGGASSTPMIHNNGGTLTISTSTIRDSAAHGIKTSAGTTTITNSDVAFNDYGLYLDGGIMSITATSTIHDNTTYGAFNNTTATSSFTAENNYWSTGTSTATSGPYHSALNPSGTGDTVSNYVDFDPWIGQTGTTSLPHFLITNVYAVEPGVCILPYTASTTYSSQLTNAVNTWNGLPRLQLVATTSNSIWNVDIGDVSRSDVAWRGQTTLGNIAGVGWVATSTIELNSYYLDSNPTSYIQKTITHELGHALGLDHSFTGNVMYDFASSQTSLGSQDELDYDYQWSAETDWSNVCP